MRILEIFVLPGCTGCLAASLIAARVRERALPCVEVRLVDLSEPGAARPAAVFAVPTYLLNGRMLSLGNPELEWLHAQLSAPG